MFRGLESEPLQLDEEGHLGPIKDGCIVAAERTLFERKDKDTNPRIVQMVHRGKPIEHWYYRSKEWVDQPYFFPNKLIQPYRGPAEDALTVLYGKGTYEEDKDVYKSGERLFTK